LGSKSTNIKKKLGKNGAQKGQVWKKKPRKNRRQKNNYRVKTRPTSKCETFVQQKEIQKRRETEFITALKKQTGKRGL